MYQPLLMNKTVFEKLNKAQQNALMAGAKKAEAYYLSEAKKEDQASVDVFKKNGVEIKEMSADEFNAWQTIAKKTSYKKFVEGYKDGQRLLDLALSVK